MGFPTNENQIFTQVTLLSGKKIGIKPWRVKEEKELLFATEGAKEEDVKPEIIKFIGKCVDNQTVYESLSSTDYVYLLVELRKLSKGSKIEYTTRCSCKFDINDDVSLINDLKVKSFHPTPVVVNDSLTIHLKEVSYTEMEALKAKYEKVSEYNYHYLIHSIDSLVINGEVNEQFTEEGLIGYIDTLSSSEFAIIGNAIDEASASITLTKTVKCGRCGKENSVDFGDLYHFLAF
jgi:hypothetical protein